MAEEEEPRTALVFFKWPFFVKMNSQQADLFSQILVVWTVKPRLITLFRNKRFIIDKMFQQNASKFAIFLEYENQLVTVFYHFVLLYKVGIQKIKYTSIKWKKEKMIAGFHIPKIRRQFSNCFIGAFHQA